MKINNILAIAINDYDDPTLNQIENCKKDIEKVIEILTKKYSFEEVEFIFEKEKTTRKSLYNRLNEYFINKTSDENVLLLFAGHGQYNPHLKSSFWQPSDADQQDSSSWINLSDILTFISASNAHHISLVSDSCFAGAIFQEKFRGGGTDAFEARKSRLALSSGGLEKVSDGDKDESSPFAKTLVQVLKENQNEELPFGILAQEIILQFDKTRKQTPQFGPLNNVGHEGGSFIFKLKREHSKINDYTKFLKGRMENLFIPISPKDIETVDQIIPINEEKSKVVKKQKYLKAAKLRDEEKELEKTIYNRSWEYISSLVSPNITKTDKERSKKLDMAVKDYEEKRAFHEKDNEEKIAILKKKKLEKTERDFQSELELYFLEFQLSSKPEIAFHKNHKLFYVKKYSENVLKLYEEAIKLKAVSQNEYLIKKNKDLHIILRDIYMYQIKLLTRGTVNDVEELISLKELDMSLLNWIRLP